MTKGHKLKELLRIKGVSPEELASELNISTSSVFKYYNKDSFDSALLEKFSSFFNIPVGYFFEENTTESQRNTSNLRGNNNVLVGGDNNGTINKLSACEREVEHLKSIIEEKERLIQVLMKNSK